MNCDQDSTASVNRRDVLRVGSLAVSGSLMPGVLPAEASTRSAKADSVVFLWMGGGVTHIDSFDPKPEAPEEIRGTLGAISTNMPGVQFGEAMPQMARVANQLSLVRSFSHDSNDHLLSQVYTLSGRKVTQAQLFTEPNIGSIISRLYGPRNGLPGYIAVPGITRPGPPPHDLFVGGWLGAQYAPFCVGGQPEQPDFSVGEKLDNPSPKAIEDLNPQELTFPDEVTISRLQRRSGLLESLDDSLTQLARGGVLDALGGQYDSALNLLTSPQVREAFNINRESQETRDTYGLTKIGGRCLTARRLVEAGARFVMVDYGYDPDYGNVWDNHNAPSQNMPHISEMCMRGYHLRGIDQAFAALLTDLRERGLLERTLVVFLTEFGRTPKINARGGRDHWGACGSIFFAGAGVRPANVVGTTDKEAGYPITRGYGPADLAATIYRVLGIDQDSRLPDQLGRPHPVLDHGSPIEAVLA